MSWVDTGVVQLPDQNGVMQDTHVNNYYLQNPDKVLGEQTNTGTMYAGGQYTVKMPRGEDIRPKLREETLEIARTQKASRVGLAPAAYGAVPGRKGPDVVSPSRLKADMPAATQARVRLLEDMREVAQRVIQLETATEVDEKGLEAARQSLREQYEGFVAKYGAVNSIYNRRIMGKDAVLGALEQADGKPSSIIYRRVIGSVPIRNITTAPDAMAVSLNERGRLDFQYMGQLLDKSPTEVRDELVERQLIYHNPAGDWETAEEYLSGPLRQKLKTARAVVETRPEYARNVAALEPVQPENLTSEDITVNIGVPWIPASEVNSWVHETFQTSHEGEFYRYDAPVAQWSQARHVPSPDAMLHSEWGTKKMAADDILLHALRSSPISVTYEDAEGKRIQDVEATAAAQEKAEQMQDSFGRWVWQDPDRAERLLDRYNSIYNDLRPREFHGEHQQFPGMAASWQAKLRPHQRDAIYRVVHDGTALLAHEVGFGKTAVMAASALERKRLGLIQKPMFVVPKATHAQFASDFRGIYPGAKLLIPSPSDFDKKNRPTFLARIATEDWDGVILTDDQFKRIPVLPETEARWVEDQIAETRDVLNALEQEGHTSARTQKDIEKMIKDKEAQLLDLRAKIGKQSDDTIHFEHLGVDQLYVDEADRFKNLPFPTRMGRLKGLPNAKSDRAWDMFLKVQHVQSKGGPRESGSFARTGVVFATGTPVANTIAETWTMMRYLQLPELRRRGLDHFDPWAKTYGEVVAGLEQSPTGEYKPTQRFSRLVNLPELSYLFQNVSDIRVASEVPEMVAARPHLVGADGNDEKITLAADNYPALQDYMAEIRKRADSLGPPAPGADNMLKISSDARKASLDIRMVEPDAIPNPRGKIQIAAEQIAGIYKEEAERRGTQLVFLDLGTPKAKTKTDDQEDAEAEARETLI